MATSELGGIAEIEGWVQPVQKPLLTRIFSGLWTFTRKKPLGAFSAVIVIMLILVGDFFPAALNKTAVEFNNRTGEFGLGDNVLGIGDSPVPYLADQLAATVPFVYKFDKQNLRNRLEGSSSKHILGTDQNGRDIFSRLLYGARVTIIVSFGAVILSQLIAASIGISSGYYGGWFDKVSFRFVDIMQALPGLVVLITILGIFGSGLWQMVFIIGGISGFTSARLIRGQTLSVMASPFIESARVVGANDKRIMMRYVLPNVFALIIISMTLRVGFIVLTEATLSFLGYGLPPPFPSWGQMLSLEGREYMRVQPGLAIYPGLAIGLAVFSFNLLGDAMRDVFDPRLRGSR